MASLRLLLTKNQTNLDRLRVRTGYFRSMIQAQPLNFRKQYGPYSHYWDEWFEQAESIYSDVKADLSMTEQFVVELRDFIDIIEDQKPDQVVPKVRSKEMISLAKEAILCQHDMLHMADERIACHKEFTHKLLLVEAIDDLTGE